jgi:hypothetical protein
MMNGGSLYDLKAVLGHADIKTTEKYAHLSSTHLLGIRDTIKPQSGNKAEVISVGEFAKDLKDTDASHSSESQEPAGTFSVSTVNV